MDTNGPRTPSIDLIATGTPEEIGRQQGEALREQIRACKAVVSQLEAFRLQQPPWVPYRLFLRRAERNAYRTLKRVLAGEGSGHWSRLAGISVGSRLSIRSICLLNAFESVLSDLNRSTAHGGAAGCSALAIGPERTNFNGPIIAHNFDYLALIQPFYVLRDERPVNGLRSIQFSGAPLAGAVDGLNEAGLAVTYDYAYSTNLAAAAPLISMRLTEVLTRCRNVIEAVDHLTTTPRWGGGMIMLADADGQIASVELANAMQDKRVGTSDGVLFHSNRFCCPATRHHELSAETVYSDKAPRVLRGRRVHQSSELRDTRFTELIEAPSRFSLNDVSRVMADHGPEEFPGPDTICMHSDYWQTTASIQLLPVQRTIRIAYSSACTANYMEFAI